MTPLDWPARFQQLAATARDPRLRQFYQAGMVAGETPIEQAPLIAVDFETTGMDAQQHGILSIAMVPMTLQRIDLPAAKQWIVRPHDPLTEDSVVIHGITHSEIAGAADITDYLDEILEFAAGRIWVVHYRGIERPFLQHTLLNRIGESIEFPVIDTMQIEAQLRRKPLTPWQQLLQRCHFKHYPQPSIRLADSRARYHLPFYPPHDALTDTLACAELLQAQISHHYSPTTRARQLWL
ncbi:MAG: 3'-5' exonuclease [Gammaproteobacteria bacterium]|nr:3'-5' exonuclease [Gammaproteobacteria bacterium]